MKSKIVKALGGCAIVAMVVGAMAMAGPDNFSPVRYDESIPRPAQQVMAEPRDGATYDGRIRVYMVEPHSRWNMGDGKPYEFAFLDFAWDTLVSMNYMDTLTRTIIWNGASAGYGDIQEDNIMVMAAVFNAERVPGYADPPSGNYFDAYYVDAAAAADYMNIWPNQVTEDFTHTIFLEKGTATW